MNSGRAQLQAKDYLRIFQRRVWVIIAIFVVAVALGVALSELATKKYTATAAVVFNSGQSTLQLAGLQSSTETPQQSQQDTNVELLRSTGLAQKTAAKLGRGISPSDVEGWVAINEVGDTFVVNVSATTSSAALAAQVANTYARIFVNEENAADQAYYRRALSTVERQLSSLGPAAQKDSQGLALEERAESLATLAALPANVVTVDEVASVPTGPSSPRKTRNVALAAVLGLLIGLALAVLQDRLADRLHDPDDLRAIYDKPILGLVPDSAKLASSPLQSVPPEAQTFDLITAHLRYFNVDRPLRSLMVVSAASGDGKTTVTTFLACSAARAGMNVLLIDCDMRRPSISNTFSLPGAAGLADVIVGDTTLEDALCRVTVPGAAGLDEDTPGQLQVLTAGALLPLNPAELLESHAMATLLADAQQRYDMVLLDTPPLTVVPDALPLLLSTDGVVVVFRLGRSRRRDNLRLAESLGNVGAAVIGIVGNGAKRLNQHGYGYGYYGANQATRDPAALPTSSFSEARSSK